MGQDARVAERNALLGGFVALALIAPIAPVLVSFLAEPKLITLGVLLALCAAGVSIAYWWKW